MSLAPELWIIAGPNGSGKTTLTQRFIPPEIPVINPDEIARKLAGNTADMERFTIPAARQALKDRKELIDSKTSFAVETTLSGEGGKRLVEAAKSAGYKINLVYVCLDSPDKSVNRVRQRVQRGGHDVPEFEIRRRYERSLENLPQVITQVDWGMVIDNSSKKQHTVAEIEQGEVLPLEPCEWFEKALSRAGNEQKSEMEEEADKEQSPEAKRRQELGDQLIRQSWENEQEQEQDREK